MTPRGGRPNIPDRWPILVWIAVILAVSSVPGPTLAKVGFSVQDKLAHLGEYAVLGWLLARHSRRRRQSGRSTVARVLLWGALVGAVDENYQRLIPGRESDLQDWAMDVVGCAFGAAPAFARWGRGKSSSGGSGKTAPRRRDEEKA